MKEHKELAIRALERMKGDDTYRARCAFRGFSQEEMNMEYGESGRTRAEILRGYEEHDAKIDAAIEWAKSIGDQE